MVDVSGSTPACDDERAIEGEGEGCRAPVVDIVMPDGSTYEGESVPEGCTVAQWRELLESGGAGDKVLYARKLTCYAGREKPKLLDGEAALPLRPEVLVVNGPGAILQMLELALRKRLGAAKPPPIVAAEGRAFACASASCCFMVHSDPGYGGYCCALCLEGDGRGHSPNCEMRAAPSHAPKAKPQNKYRKIFATHEDLLEQEALFRPLAGEAKKKAYELVKHRGALWGAYCDYDEIGAPACRKKLNSQNAEHAWTLDFNLDFYCELLYEGIFPMGVEFGDGLQALLFCYDRKVSVWDFHETHVSRQVRKHAKHHSMTVDTAFDKVILGCVRQHGEAWLYSGYRQLLRRLFKEGYTGKREMHFGVHSFELWDAQGELIAGDLGYTIGGFYGSMTGFRQKDTKHCGEVQMVLTAGLLHKMGFDWMDLGQVLKYKQRMGAKVISRKEYFQRLSRDRDKDTAFGHERVGGQVLLAAVLQAVADGPKPIHVGSEDEYVVVEKRVAVRKAPSLDAPIISVQRLETELTGTPCDVGGVPWLQLEEGWVLMDGKSVGLGPLVTLKSRRVDYGDGDAEAQGESSLPAAVEGEEQKPEAQAESSPPAAAEGEEQKPEAQAESSLPAAAEGEEQKPEDAAQGGRANRPDREAPQRKGPGKEGVDRKSGAISDDAQQRKEALAKAVAKAAAEAARKQAAERVARLQRQEEDAAQRRDAAAEAERHAEKVLERYERDRPRSLKELKKKRRAEEVLRQRAEQEAAARRAEEEKAAKLAAEAEAARRRAAEAEAARKKAEELAALKKIADQEAAVRKVAEEKVVRAMVLFLTGDSVEPSPSQPKSLSREQRMALAERCQPTMPDLEREDAEGGRVWIVTGGADKGGILVRAAESTASRQFPTRLSTGAQVEELDIAGNRLHFKRLRGDGPDWGWVSVVLAGRMIVEPMG